MLKYTVKRLLYSVIILLFVMFIIYTLMASMPGNYLEQQAQALATRPGATKSATEWLEDLNKQYGMDQNVFVGYFTWLKNAVQGNFGDSWKWTKPVTQVFGETIWYSFALSLITTILQVIIAIPLGIHAARKQYHFSDYFTTVMSMISISLPTFFIASVFKFVFVLKLGWFDISGMQSRDYHNLSDFGKFLDVAKHFVLPALTLTIISIGGLMRHTRTNMLEVLNSDYIRTARAKGVPEKKVINHHAFRNIMVPLISILGGSLPSLFSGALITETLFSLRGIGYASYQSMSVGDVPFTMFYLAFISILTLLGNLMADLMYGLADPRVRLS